jgi:hypothetical protein
MRREGRPDPGISLSDQSTVVNNSEVRVKYERRAKTLVGSFKATQIGCQGMQPRADQFEIVSKCIFACAVLLVRVRSTSARDSSRARWQRFKSLTATSPNGGSG